MSVAEYEFNDSPESWIKRADNALYQAKGSGKNCVY
ncbi:MAG: diguanylate cyclase [Sinobacterium sp.]|nr:diguanylate cyclase [Sinobacterium sp.]